MKHQIFGVVAQCGAGKSTLITSIAQRMPHLVEVVPSVTTRKRRGPEDDLFYRFVSLEEFEQLRRNFRLAEHLEYAGNFYGLERDVLDSLLSNWHGIMAVTQEGVLQLRAAGYPVVVIMLDSPGQPEFRDEVRQQADRERAQIALKPEHTIVNSFAPGGLELSLRDLETFISSYVARNNH
jgi:guanylate kinase